MAIKKLAPPVRVPEDKDCLKRAAAARDKATHGLEKNKPIRPKR